MQGGYAKMDNWRLKYERLITPVFRTYWRFSRAATLGVRGVATNEAGHQGAVFDAEKSGRAVRFRHEPSSGVAGGVQSATEPAMSGCAMTQA